MIGTGAASRWALVTLFAALVTLHAPAQAAVTGWSTSAGLAGGANPTVLGATGSVTRTRALYSDRTGVLWDSARFEAGIDLLLNPSFTDVGARLFIEPVAVFDLTLRLGMRGFYDTFGFGLAGLDGYAATPPAASGDGYSGVSETGWFAGVSPRLKLAVGPVVAANTFTATRYDFSGASSPFLEEPLTLNVIERTDWVLENETLILYRLQGTRASFAGVGPSYRIAWTPAARDVREPSHRIAVAGVYVLEPTGRIAVQAAVFLGMYPTGEPIETDRPFALAALTLIRTAP